VKEQENSEAKPDAKLSPIAEEEEDEAEETPIRGKSVAQKQVDKELEKLEKQKMEHHDAIDEKKDKSIADLRASIKKKAHMGRMFGISDPKWLIVVAVIFSLGIGASQPFFGIYIGKMLFVLQPPEPIT